MVKLYSSGTKCRNWNRGAKVALGFAVAAVVCLGQSVPRQAPFGGFGWAQKGGQWVRTGTLTPFEISDQIHRVQLVVHGNVIIRGISDNRVHGDVRQTVRATSEQAAAIALGSTFGNAGVQGDLLQLEFLPPTHSRFVISDIDIYLPSRLAVLIQNQEGSIVVNDFAAGVTATTNGGAVQMDRITGNVIGTTISGDIQFGDIGGTVNCLINQGGDITLHSATGAVSCRSGGGNVNMKYVGGALDVITDGNIHADQVIGNVRARSMGGSIEIVQAGGTVTADTPGGSIEVGSSKGVKAESGAGRVKVRGGSGPMNVSTMMGDVLAELVRGGQLTNSTISTAAGDIVLMIPAGMGLSVHAQNSSGWGPRIQSDFPEIQVKSIGLRAPMTGQGSINGGGPMIDLTAAGGSIFLRKAK